ncbi:hypothetical protein A9G13_07155 [Gilliamella sp. wkB178]|uniref:hypothetical protein n=1 Tax=Gilliamella sp. wkB178 TaxID=3120259 RepID=UPI00080E1430|nr:hypothetical protein [Gilliamella apicola]OCG07973.1 hypothetical protein A9G13_07155 [Gilliamella apicola]
MPYATTTQALSATTAQVIHGTQPYLTFDNGVTKVTTTEGLLGITISDGTTQTTYTPDNTSTAANPIVLPVANQRFTDIGMLVPTNTDSIALNALIGAPYNYWGDDDGDGQGVDGITASGNLSVRITDKDNQAVSRNAVLSICGAPYKVELTSTAGSLTTQYGLPNSSNFTGSTATYYISPKAEPRICYARPSLDWGYDEYKGPANIWNEEKGFLVQSTSPSSYGTNFPTTGANNLYFDLLVAGIDGSKLTWSTINQGDITATLTPNPPEDYYFNPDGASTVRVTLKGPAATTAQQQTQKPGLVTVPNLPQQFEIVGYDSNHTAVVKYGFVLKQWFIVREDDWYQEDMAAWCPRIGYRLIKIKDVTNAFYTGIKDPRDAHRFVGATPSSTGNHLQRNIGAGFLTEWSNMHEYGYNYTKYWTSEVDDINRDFIIDGDGSVRYEMVHFMMRGACTYP